MKRIDTVLFGTLFVGCLIAINPCFRIQRHAEAEEPVKQKKGEPESKTTDSRRDAHESGSGLAYPNFNIIEVTDIVRNETDALMARKLTKSSDELRKNIGRTEFSTLVQRANNREVSSPDLYRRTIESIFLVVGLTRPTGEEKSWRTAFSTAFVVHEDGILSTSAHVFDNEDHDDAVVVFDVKGKVHPVTELLAVNRRADTCLFRISAKQLKPIPFGKDVPPGSEIRVIAHPGDSLFYFTAGHIGNYERDDEGQNWMNITADFGQGSSGGPVMDAAGNVVGQVSRTYTLYAGGETTARRRKFHSTQQEKSDPVADPHKKEIPGKDNPADRISDGGIQDPQMVFKACTPVSAIRSLIK